MRKVALILTAVVVATASIAQPVEPVATLPGGARWRAEVPQNWNGTLLLWSRGYSATAALPEIAPPTARAELLAAGYALAASDYGAGGWALEEAVPAQRATIAAFGVRYGKPKRVIAWGYSMGGLVTSALAEQRPAAVDGGVALCSSIGGAVGMMNMALDGASAFRTLIAPDAGIRIVDVDDDRVNAKRVDGALADAIATPQGRARIALAGVLAGIPGWTSRDEPEPAPRDYEAQAAEIAKSFTIGVFLPRVDQEKRAGGAFSWNKGIDYRAQLARSGRRPMVEALYRAAGLNLAADLAKLNAAPRVTAKPAAVDYIMRNYTPTARPAVPLLAVQKVGDGQTSPSLQLAYAQAAKGANVQSLWVRQSGHCGFATDTLLASIRQVEARLGGRDWPAVPAGFARYTPPPMLRPCVRGEACR